MFSDSSRSYVVWATAWLLLVGIAGFAPHSAVAGDLCGPPAPPDHAVVWNTTVDLAGVGRAHRMAWWHCGAAGADFAVTELVIARGGAEANPFMRNRTVRVVGTVGSCAALHLVADHHPKAARVLSWVGIGLRGLAIGWNVYQVSK